MKKLSLDLDTLAVESFATGDGDGTRGTVRANSATLGCSEYWSCLDTCGICDGNESHRATCGNGSRCGYTFEFCPTDDCASDYCESDYC